MEHEASPWVFFGMAMFVAAVLALVSILSTRHLRKIPITRMQNLLELSVSALKNYTVSIIGPGGEKHTSFIGTLFIYILCMNLLGLIPAFKSPTSNLTITASLAIVVFIYYNYAGIRATGLKAWWKHLMGEPVWLFPLMLPIHIIGELARPLSLAVRLYGNIFGEETVIAILAAMSFVVIPHVIAVPYQLPLMIFGVFTAFVQALVFSSLAAIYIGLAVANHEH